ncbi:LOW QUALITY PROTEIN: hypothetical protein BC938DRAFT_483611 [Jimgerdemannia flammicorona]|uniref:Uncharacterized protein n=1 Tax=Jimgerdemannia flammicorona TaxID=994334 RepID=A0A433QBK3_9FUNG|nr:LOW QUALITY PROTEIN: hypothetical protein BC938DRAFT_483611 [Jimgerdemannia flammicorona]
MSKRSMQSCGSASSLHEETPSQKVIEKMNIKYENAGVSGQFKDFLKTVVTFTGDLSALTCPTFFLNGQSLLEYSWGPRDDASGNTKVMREGAHIVVRTKLIGAVLHTLSSPTPARTGVIIRSSSPLLPNQPILLVSVLVRDCSC